MDQKGKRLPAAGLIFSIFLWICAAVNFVSGHIGAAIGSLGAGIFYLAFASAAHGKLKSGENKQ